jgi:hypothetical protein
VTIMTITGRYICSANNYVDNNMGGICAVLAFIVTITGKSVCSASSYCDNNDNNVEVYRQC